MLCVHTPVRLSRRVRDDNDLRVGHQVFPSFTSPLSSSIQPHLLGDEMAFSTKQTILHSLHVLLFPTIIIMLVLCFNIIILPATAIQLQQVCEYEQHVQGCASLCSDY